MKVIEHSESVFMGKGRRLRLLLLATTLIAVDTRMNSLTLMEAASIDEQNDFSTRLSTIIASSSRSIRQDKRRGSKLGRTKKLKRSPCRWMDEYLGTEPVYTPKQFRDRFGITIAIFHTLLARLKPKLEVKVAADGTPGMSAELALLTALRILRTGALSKRNMLKL